MALAYADIPSGTAVSPWIGGAMSSGPGRPDRPQSQIFPSSTGLGGTSIAGRGMPASGRPAIADAAHAPLLDDGFKKLADGSEVAINTGINGTLDGLGDTMIKGGVITTALAGHYAREGIDAARGALTIQGPSATFEPMQPAAGPAGIDPAIIEAMHGLTMLKSQMIRAGVSFSDIGLSGADLNTLSDPTQAIDAAREFAQAKQQQPSGLSVS